MVYQLIGRFATRYLKTMFVASDPESESRSISVWSIPASVLLTDWCQLLSHPSYLVFDQALTF